MEDKEDSELKNQINNEDKDNNNNLLKENEIDQKIEENKQEIPKNENENEIKEENKNDLSNENEDKISDNKEKDNKEKDNEEKEIEEKEIKDDNTNEYIFRCEICHLIPIIKIDHKTYKIHCKCENGHIKTNINISKALNENNNFSMKKCSLCEEKSNEGNYICVQCQKIFCLDNGCKKKHLKENSNHKLIDIDNFDTTCFEHYNSISKYCNDCKKNICIKCQRVKHGGHKLIDLGEVLPLPEEIEQGKKIFEEKKEKLENLKKCINDWLDEFNKKVKNLLDSIDAEIKINENILKNFKSDLMNYQMIENFNYFSSSKEIYSSSELMTFVVEKNFLNKILFISQALNKIEGQIQIKDEMEDKNNDNIQNINNNNESNNNNKNNNNNNINNKTSNNKMNYDNNNINNINIINNSNNNIKKSVTSAIINFNENEKNKVKDKDKDKEKNNSSNEILLKSSKTLPAPLLLNNVNINGKEFYWSLNEIKNKKISRKNIKLNINIKEKIYSGLIDNKGIIFLGGDSCLYIYRFDLKTGKIETEFLIKGFDGAINTICEVKDDLLVVGTSSCMIKIIEFLGNKKYHIHQEIRNADKNSIYKIIELSNYDLIICDEISIVMLDSDKNNYYNIIQTIKLDTPTCCVLQISEKYIATSHVVLNKISIYEFNKKQINLIKEIENIELTTSNNSMAVINDDYFCSIANKNIYIISSENFNIVKKIEYKMNITNLFPVSQNMILLCHSKENDKGKIDYILSLKSFNEKVLLTDYDQFVANKNNEHLNDIFYLNFFNPYYMVIISKSNISVWG